VRCVRHDDQHLPLPRTPSHAKRPAGNSSKRRAASSTLTFSEPFSRSFAVVSNTSTVTRSRTPPRPSRNCSRIPHRPDPDPYLARIRGAENSEPASSGVSRLIGVWVTSAKRAARVACRTPGLLFMSASGDGDGDRSETAEHGGAQGMYGLQRSCYEVSSAPRSCWRSSAGRSSASAGRSTHGDVWRTRTPGRSDTPPSPPRSRPCQDAVPAPEWPLIAITRFRSPGVMR
jgi:hypothetical protein